MRIQLSDHFTYSRLIRFVLPSIAMMIFTSIYSVVDGLFVSNFAGKDSFAAVNLVMPVLMGLSAIGFMFGTGGSAVVAKTLGEGDNKRANRYFSMFIYTILGLGIIIAAAGFMLMDHIVTLLGASNNIREYCIIYARISFLSLPCFMLQIAFQSFFVAAEKASLSLKMSIASGLTNAVLDYVFIAVFDWGVAGAAAATAIGEFIGGLTPIFYFARKNNSLLRLTKTRLEPKVIGKGCLNGSSEMLTNLSASIVNILYNFQLMRFAGDDGIAAYGTIMYVNFIFIAVFMGYAVGSAPLVGYNYGSENKTELKNLLKKSLTMIGLAGISMLILAELLAKPLTKFFVGYDDALFEMTCYGLRIYAAAFLVNGFNIYVSSFFTALNNGVVSGIISFLRTFVFQIVVVMILPIFFGLNGIWGSIIIAEVLALFVSIAFLMVNRKKYGY
ncbi:MAG: MATE family efflux transporter [Firmicutes bacterium]|nr:MATE family efflux transporter [Bacillota bacterium]